MRINLLPIAGAVALALGLSACEGVKEQLGLTKQPPDEFRVQAQAPLSLPPDFKLRPPRPGASRPQEGTVQDQARRAVFRAADAPGGAPNGTTPGDGRSLGEQALLQAAGAGKADPNIRRLVDREADRRNDEDDTFLDFLVFWREPEPTGTVIDAAAESKRLRENAALGKSVTEGETPSIERRKKALLEGLF